MDWSNTCSGIINAIKKYRYVLFILLAGVLLMMVPQDTPKEKTPDHQAETIIPEDSIQLESALEEILGHMDGAGKVKVLLTEAAGESVYYQQDNDSRTSETQRDTNNQTVIVTDAQRNEQGLVCRIDPPVYLGAVILCQGADRAAVRLSIVEAVSTATGLSSDRITVIKMK